MTDINIIFSNLKTYHYKPWDEDKLEECKKILKGLSKDELRSIRHSRFMDTDNALYPTLFELLFQDELKSILDKMTLMPTEELIQELRTTRSAFKKEKIPEILLERYDSMEEDEKKNVFKILLRKGLIDKENNTNL